MQCNRQTPSLQDCGLEGCLMAGDGQWQSLTRIKDSLQCLDVCGDARDPVDADLLNASLLHLLDALAHNVRHLGALTPAASSHSSGLLGLFGPQLVASICPHRSL
uniref:Uncharacterized protein n=1 Tax=Gallus gallus TaxID=9031 RepID=A0A8V1APX3_CHICK